MSYKDAVHHAHVVLSMQTKAVRYIRDLFEAPDVSTFVCGNVRFLGRMCSTLQNEVESIRLRTTDYEMVVAQHGNFTMIATQHPSKGALKTGATEEKKEAVEEKKEAA